VCEDGTLPLALRGGGNLLVGDLENLVDIGEVAGIAADGHVEEGDLKGDDILNGHVGAGLIDQLGLLGEDVKERDVAGDASLLGSGEASEAVDQGGDDAGVGEGERGVRRRETE